MAGGEPNLDLGLDFTGGVAKPSVADVNRYARVGLDDVGDPQFTYVDGVERQVYLGTSSNFTNSLAKTSLLATVKIPAGKFIGTGQTSVPQKVRILIQGEFPASLSKVGVDVYGVGTEMSLLTAGGVPAAGAWFRFECEIYPTAFNAQHVISNLQIAGVTTVGASLPKTADFSVEQEIRVTAQLANLSDTLRFRRVEIFTTGI